MIVFFTVYIEELNKFLIENSVQSAQTTKTTTKQNKKSMMALSILDCVHQGAGLGSPSSVAARPPFSNSLMVSCEL